MQIQSTDYLIWQHAQPANKEDTFTENWQSVPIDNQYSPQPVKSCLPEWFVDLPANLKQLQLEKPIENQSILSGHGHRSAKLCLGLRGIRTLGWTIPLSHDLANPSDYLTHDGNIGRKEIGLHPAMLTGSGFDQKRSDGRYQWQVRILSFPWRAQMAPGWRLMITAHPLVWSPDWFCFSGCVDANYRHDSVNIGNFWDFKYNMDLSLNYYNVEVVIAIRSCEGRTVTIPAGTCLFSMIPIWDPEYQRKEFKEFPNFN
jgi:hypothetical protein